MSTPAPIDDETKRHILELKEAAVSCFKEADSVAAIAVLVAERDPFLATRSFIEVMRHFYWKEKNLAAAIAFGRAGLQHGMTAASAIEPLNPAGAFELRCIAKGMAYDLASFAWTGWNEPGIEITPSDLQVGLDAARANLRLAVELNRGDLPLSRAWWMLAGQQLAIDHYEDAFASFEQGAEFATKAGSQADHLLCRGFAALTKVLESNGRTGTQDLDAIKQQLQPLDDGPFFVEQMDTAYKVFAKPSPS